MALAIEVLRDLDDDLLRASCIKAMRDAGKSFVLAQHIFAAAKPELDYRREMAQLAAREQEAQRTQFAELGKPPRVTGKRANEILAEFGMAKGSAS